MSLKLKLMRKQAFGSLNDQNQVEKASWIEILRRLREALEQAFRFLSRCIDDDVENILGSESWSEQDESVEWTNVREKYLQLAHNCLSLLSDLNPDTSSTVVDDLQAVINFFRRTKSTYAPSKKSTVAPQSAVSSQNSVKLLKWKTNEDEKSMDDQCTTSSVNLTADCKSSVSKKTRTYKSDEKRSTIGGSTHKRSREDQSATHRQKSDHSLMCSSRRKNGDGRRNSDARTSVSSLPLPRAGGPLLIFDCHGNPLTDHSGVPLINRSRKLVIKYKDDKPVSHTNGEPIFDEYGLPFVASFDEPLRDPEGKPLRLFNQENIPLTDGNGMVLKLNNGNHSIVLDEHNRILGDSFGSPIYDDKGKMLSGNLASRNKQLSDSFGAQEDGTCIMLYNEKGFLLTDKYGKPLTTAAGQPLMEFGPNGEITDVFGGPVFDEHGKMYGSKARVPYLRVFDCDKFPLTSGRGDVLCDAGGKPLLIFDPSGKPVSNLTATARLPVDSNEISRDIIDGAI